MATITLPFAASATKRVPDGDELANGYGCGDADLQLFDWLAWWLTGQIGGAIDAGGLSVDDTLLTRLAHAIQSGKSNYAVATGTANAWTVAPNLAVPTYGSGRPLNIIAPATNTSTTVNMNVSGLGNRRIKKADGTDPAIGDLVSGKIYPTIDDGTNIRILTPLPSEMLLPPAGASTTRAPLLARLDARHTAGQVIPTSAFTLLTFGTTDGNSLGTSTWSGSRLTVGAGEGGVWSIQAGWVMSPTVGDCYMATRLRKNGTTVIGESVPTYLKLGDGGGTPVNILVPLDPGDYVEALAIQQTGSGQNTVVDYRSRFVAMLMAAK